MTIWLISLKIDFSQAVFLMNLEQETGCEPHGMTLYELYCKLQKMLRNEIGLSSANTIAFQVNEFFGWEPKRRRHFRIISVYLDQRECLPPIIRDDMLAVDGSDMDEVQDKFAKTWIPELKNILRRGIQCS